MNKWFTKLRRTPVTQLGAGKSDLEMRYDHFLRHKTTGEQEGERELLLLNQVLAEIGSIIDQVDLLRSNRYEITQKLPTERRQ